MPESVADLHIGYVLKQYPRLSETFILNEILGLEAAGVTASVFSLRNPTEGKFHPGVADVKADVHYVANADKTAFLDALRSVPQLRADALPEALAFVDQLPADRRARLLLGAIEVAREATARGVDHLHAHFLTVAAHTAHLAHLLTGIPYSVTAHAKDIYRHTVDWQIAAQIADAATAVVTVCDANLQFLAHRLDGTDVNLVRIYNGLGPQDPPATPAAHTAGLVLGVGRLVEKKGFDLLLRSVAELTDEGHDVRCVLIGDGDERADLERLADELDIAGHVEFAGALPQHEVAVWLRRAHVMVAPCRIGADGNQDALPTVLLEALGAGLPAVTTPVAGIPEIIEHETEGLIVPCDDVDALTTAVEQLLTDPARHRAMAAAGPRKLATVFDRAQTIQQLVATFDPAPVPA